MKSSTLFILYLFILQSPSLIIAANESEALGLWVPQQDVDELTRQLYIAYGEADHQEVVDLYEQIIAINGSEDSGVLSAMVAESYKQIGQKEKGEALMASYTEQLTSSMMDNPTMAALMNMGQKYAPTEEEEARADEEKRKKEELNKLRDDGAMNSIMQRLGVVDSSQREDTPSFGIDASQMADMTSMMVDMMALSGDMTSEQLARARELANSGSTADIMKIAAMGTGMSEEEMLQNMQGAAEIANQEMPGIMPTNTQNLDDFGEQYDKNIDSLNAQSTEQYAAMRSKQLDRYDDGLYNPKVIKENLAMTLQLAEATSWPSVKDLTAIQNAYRAENTKNLNYSQQAALFGKYLRQTNPLLSESDIEVKKTKFIESAKSYEAAISSFSAANGMQDIKAMYAQYGMEDESAGTKLNFIEILLGDELNEYLPMLKAAKQEYDKASDLIDLREVNDLRFESNQLEEMGKYQNINMNIALQLMKNTKYDPFDTGESGINGYNEILAAKGADYRAKRFLLDGVKASDNPSIKQDYETLRQISNEMGQVHLLSDSAQKVMGWDRQKFRSEIEKTNKLKRKIYKGIAQSADFVTYVKNWIITWEEIQNTLDPDEAFVDIYRVNSLDRESDYSYLYFIVQKDKKPTFLILEKSEIDLEDQFMEYRRIVNQGSIHKQAYSLFWKPIKNIIGQSKRVYLSPDGIYHTISLMGIYNPTTKKYLADESEIVRLVEISDIKRIKASGKPNEKIDNIYLFGFPDYKQYLEDHLESGTEKRAVSFFNAKMRLKPLKGSLIEVDSIKNIATRATVNATLFIKKEANEKNLYRLHRPSVIHLATHGKFYGKEGTSDVDKFTSSKQLKFDENPLLRSHIYLAGSQNALTGTVAGHEDGIVTGEEASHLNLSNTQLVVLSACESGLGQSFTGEGVFGIQRAFLQAGAKNMIITLWEVDDYATRDFMVFFYQNWLMSKMPIRQAFNSARSELRKKRPLPSKWAPFILIGE